MARSGIAGCLAALLLVVGVPTVASAGFDTRFVGQLTRSDGTPVAGAGVIAWQAPRHAFGGSAVTDANGRYAIGDLNPFIPYKLQFFYKSDTGQWAHQKTSFDEADELTPTEDEDTVVDEVLFPRGSLEITASDKVTGAPVNQFCAGASSGAGGRDNGCTGTGTVTLVDLPAGDYSVSVAENDTYFAAHSTASVSAGTATRVHFELEPVAYIATTMQDAVTHAPVPFACLQAIGNLGGFTTTSDCSDRSGQVKIRKHAGQYRLYVSAMDGVHGDQWVGPNGGIGIKFLARVVDAVAGQTVTVPPVQLDGAGSISGTVVDKATGEPVKDACAYPHAGAATGGPGSGPECTNANGEYTIGHVGPYAWPVQFTGFFLRSHPWQWSGDRPSQLSARLVTVQVGRNTVLDAHLGPAASVSGRVTRADGQPVTHGTVLPYNAFTGESVANAVLLELDGSYTLTGIAGPQFIRLLATSDGVERWSDPVLVRSGSTVSGIDLVLPQGS